jgi:hypothetical protein
VRFFTKSQFWRTFNARFLSAIPEPFAFARREHHGEKLPLPAVKPGKADNALLSTMLNHVIFSDALSPRALQGRLARGNDAFGFDVRRVLKTT